MFSEKVCIRTPCYYNNFLPVLMQVNFLPWYFETKPLDLHTDPAFVAALAGILKEVEIRAIAIRVPMRLFIIWILLRLIGNAGDTY